MMGQSGQGQDVKPTRDLSDKVPAVPNIGAGRSKSLEKEKGLRIYKGCRVSGLLAPKSGWPDLSQLCHHRV